MQHDKRSGKPCVDVCDEQAPNWMLSWRVKATKKLAAAQSKLARGPAALARELGKQARQGNERSMHQDPL